MLSASNLQQRTRALVAEATRKLSPATFLRSAVADMDRPDVDALAAAYLLSQVKASHRRATLTIERDAERPKTPEAAAMSTEIELRAERENRDALKSLWADMNKAADKYKEALYVEWTDELLDAEFATGDGSTVRWGEATREQHEDRYNMHKRNAMAGMEGAARHRQAIETLDATGCDTLREAVKVAA